MEDYNIYNPTQTESVPSLPRFIYAGGKTAEELNMQEGQQQMESGDYYEDDTNEPHSFQEESVTAAENNCLWESCTLTFGSTEELVAHISEDHIGRKRSSYTCEWRTCSRRGAPQATRFSLVAHMRTHTGEKPYICHECGRGFTRSDAMSKHLKSHSTASSGLRQNDTKKPQRRPSAAAKNTPVKSEKRKHSMEQQIAFAEAINWNGQKLETKDKFAFEKLANTPITEQYSILKSHCRYLIKENRILRQSLEVEQRKIQRIDQEKDLILDQLMKDFMNEK